MRASLFPVVGAALLAATAAHGEKRIFIIANNADGYGVDRCLASGDRCGSPIATAYCRARDFRKAVSFRRVVRDDITGAVPEDAASCPASGCDDFVAIECAR